jgi:hypothetical protein
LLPIFPFVSISTGKLAGYFDRRRWTLGALVAALLLWGVSSSLAVFPHHLSYFSELAGGPDNGYKYLADCNMDWGQDLLFLKRWLNEHPEAKPLRLAYFGSVDPRVVGIEFALPPPAPNGLFRDNISYRRSLGPHPGWYAISINYLCGISAPAADGQGGHRLIPLHEYEYFQHFRPVAKAGSSVFIYHISLDEANAVRHRVGLPELDQ